MAVNYANVWMPGKTFKDELSHFNKFTSETVQKFFGVNGQWANVNGAPNWVQPNRVEGTDGQLEYQLIRMNDVNELEQEFPISIVLAAKDGIHLFEAPDQGKGKAVAYWNYRLNAGALSFWSDDQQKTIICDAEQKLHAIPCRMTPMSRGNQSYNQLRMSVEGGEMAITPFVVLAFLMWLESDDPGSVKVKEYLTKIGWKHETSS